jgi:hypothetical protein
MEKSNAEILIERIEDAKGWLEKAKAEYSNSNPDRGGLILNLAQAEVKHAWELSHQQYVLKSVPQTSRNRKFKYIIPIAASLALFTSLAIGVRFAGVFSTADKSKTLSMVKKTSEVSKDLKPIVSNKAPFAMISEKTKSNETVTQNSPTPSSSSNVQPAVVAKPNIDSVRYMNSLTHQTGSNVIQNKPTLKAVSKLAIDEDALTKEASHSLRIGE